MHYLMRSILGYRLGTILSYYSQIILYYQTKKLIKILTKSESKLVPIIANMSFLVYIMYVMVGTYYIDIFSTIFIMEIICLSFEHKNFFENKGSLYLSFLYTGLATGIKVPNVIPITVVYVFILIKNIKNLKYIKWYDIGICIALFLTPFIVYVIDNVRQTGSIMFPYYNNIFKSEYFGDFSWHDKNFGIPNVLWSLIWPFVIIIDPKKGYDAEYYDFMWPIGYAIILIYIGYAIIKHKKIKEDLTFQMAVLSFTLTIIWAIFLMAYTRYCEFLPALYIVVFSTFILNISKLNIAKLKKVALYFIAIIVSIVMSYATLVEVARNVLSFPSLFLVIKRYGIIEDRKEEKIDIDGAWLVVADDSKMATLVRKQGTPIYNLETRFLTNEKTLKMQEKLRQEKLYFLVDDYEAKRKFKALERNNFQIVEVIKEDFKLNFMGRLNYITMYRVEYNPNSDEVKQVNSKYEKEKE